MNGLQGRRNKIFLGLSLQQINALSFYGSKMILDRPNHLGRVPIVLVNPKHFGQVQIIKSPGSSNLNLIKMIWTRPKDNGLSKMI